MFPVNKDLGEQTIPFPEAMQFPEIEPEREDRISMTILVDTYDEAEQALGWYYYLENQLDFPFQAYWLKDKSDSQEGREIVEVVGMAPEDDCFKEMVVKVRYQDESGEEEFAVPLSDIQAIAPDPDTEVAIADWHYWLDMGYEL
jgi:hypothetical protein